MSSTPQRLGDGVFLATPNASAHAEVVPKLHASACTVVRRAKRAFVAHMMQDAPLPLGWESGGLRAGGPGARSLRRGHLRYDINVTDFVSRRAFATLRGAVEARALRVVANILRTEYRQTDVRTDALRIALPRMLLALPGPNGQDWHTDVEPLFNARAVTPPFFFTIFLPAVDVTEAMGRTEFRTPDGTRFAPALCAGDMLLFHGLVEHRGAPCSAERALLYCTVAYRWFRDVNVGEV
jgi:hypothetical protein